MAVSYKRLWKLLIDKKVSPAAAEIAPNTMTKPRRDEPVSLSILGRICRQRNCDVGEIFTCCDDKDRAAIRGSFLFLG